MFFGHAIACWYTTTVDGFSPCCNLLRDECYSSLPNAPVRDPRDPSAGQKTAGIAALTDRAHDGGRLEFP